MSISYWNIYVENSSGGWDSDGTIPRPNENIENNTISTMQTLRLANGSNAFFFPDTKSIKEQFTMFFAETSSTLRTQIQSYIDNGDKVKITTHTSQDYIGYFSNMKRVWFTGISPDTYDLQVSFQESE